MQQIPLQAIPNQIVKAPFGSQNTQIALYQKSEGLFCDIYSDGSEIVTGILSLDGVPIVCREYAGFSGQLLFADTQGSSDPDYTGLGSRYQLIYLTETEYAALV